MKARTYDLTLSTANVHFLNSANGVIKGPIIEVLCEDGKIASQLSAALNELGANSTTHSSRLDSNNESRLVAIQVQVYEGDKIIINLRSGYDFSNVDIISSILGYPTEMRLIFTFPCQIKTSVALKALQDLLISEPHSSPSNELLSPAIASSSSNNAPAQNNQDNNPLSASAASTAVSMIQKMVMSPIGLINIFARSIACKTKSVFNHKYKSDTNVVVEFNEAEDGFNFSQTLAKLGIVNATGKLKAVGNLRDSEGNDHDYVVIMSRDNMNALLTSQVQILGSEFKLYESDQDLQV